MIALKAQVRTTLGELMARSDRDWLLHTRRLEGLLKDLCPGHKPEIHVLLCSLRASVPQELLKNSGGDVDIVLTRLVDRLGQSYAIETSAAGWAVEAWASALGAIPPEEVGGREWIGEDEQAEMQAAPADEKPSYEGPEFLHVSPDGSAPFKRIRHALEASEPGHTIVLKPGLYREALAISDAVKIVGDGEPGDVVIESTNNHTLVLDGATCEFANLTFHAITSSAAQPIYAVAISHGRHRFDRCRIAGAGEAAVVIAGKGAEPFFSMCAIGDGPGRGVVCSDMAKPVFADCDIFGHASACVDVRQWAAPSFQRTRIRDSRVNGITVLDYGVGVFNECDIFNHWLAGVSIASSGNPTLDRCRVHDCRAHGVWISEKGEGTIKNCELYDNGRGGIYVDPACKPRLVNNTTR